MNAAYSGWAVFFRGLNGEEVLRWWVDGRRLLVAFDEKLKRPRITRISANKCGVFRAGRVFRGLNVEEVLWRVAIK
jgi:hypothetical protein